MPSIVLSANTSWYIYNFRFNIIKELIKSGFKVIIVAPRDSHTYKLEAMGIVYNQISFDQYSKNIFKEILIIFKFFFIYRRLSPDIVLNFTPKNNIYGALACRVLNIPVINNISGLGTVFVKKNLTSYVVKLLYSFSSSKINYIFFQNTRDQNIFNSIEKIKKIPSSLLPGSGVDLKKFKFKSYEESKDIKFLLCSRMLKEKGILEYLYAAKNIKKDYKNKVEFRLLGPTDIKNPSSIKYSTLKRWHDSGVIKYMGFTDDVLTELINADCFVLPSYYSEGTPKSLLEAAAVGRPIITTENPGCKEVIDNNNGILCESRSVYSLELAMRQFLNLSNEQKNEMSKNSRLLAEKRYDEKIVIETYLEVIKNNIKIQ